MFQSEICNHCYRTETDDHWCIENCTKNWFPSQRRGLNGREIPCGCDGCRTFPSTIGENILSPTFTEHGKILPHVVDTISAEGRKNPKAPMDFISRVLYGYDYDTTPNGLIFHRMMNSGKQMYSAHLSRNSDGSFNLETVTIYDHYTYDDDETLKKEINDALTEVSSIDNPDEYCFALTFEMPYY